jgi:hypothetical protein
MRATAYSRHVSSVVEVRHDEAVRGRHAQLDTGIEILLDILALDLDSKTRVRKVVSKA